MIGKTISHYTILEKSGEGGMGIVYKAQDTRLGRFVALKFLPQHITNDEVGKRRLVQEAKAASAINHPNVCIIYDVEEADGEQFIAMEYVEGVTLRSKIYESEISLDEAVSYVLQIGEALEEAHSKGVIHRDVKPDNIMVNPKNQVKVMDFGLARLKDAILQSRKSSTVGTLAYMAPEQIQGGEIDHRADIFALGVVLYEMLTRRLPFNAVHEAAMMYSILHEEPEPIQKHLPDAPSELVHILERALEKEPSDRYQSVKEMTIDLLRLRKQSTSSFPATKVGASKTDRNHRRLAAIMFTDMVGYSAMAQQNESLALELLSIHREILRSIFPTFGGKEIGTIGDAFFLEFASALDASRCACEIQRKMFDHNALASGEKKIQIRIGVHLGDVVYVENNVQGDGVNIAARIEPLAEPGGICISEDVARQIRNKIDMPIVKLGKAQLKNIQLPVDIYEIVLPWQKRRVPTTQRIMFSLRRKGVRRFVGAASVLVISSLFILYQKSGKTTLRDDGATNPSLNQTPAESSALHNDDVTVKAAEETVKESGIVQGKENGHVAIRANAQKDVSSPLNFKEKIVAPPPGEESRSAPLEPAAENYRVAVLPFSNISPDSKDEYFADGMTEELISTLSRIQGLRLIARTSVMQYKGVKKSVAEIGRDLKVKAVLEGSVRKSGNKLRISVQLIDAASEEHLWSEEYDRELTDVFAIQGNVAQRVAEALQVKMLAGERQQLGRSWTTSTEAYTLYLQGRFYWNKRSPPDLLASVEFFKKASQKDPRYALSYAGIADAYTMLGNYYVLSPADAYPKAKAAAQKALEIDESLTEAHTSLAFALMHYDWDWRGAEREFQRAITLNPSDAVAHSWYAYYLTVTGRFEEAVAVRKRAQELDPLSVVISSDVGLTLYFGRKYDETIEQFRTTLKSDPSFYAAYIPLGAAFLHEGRFDEAITAFKKARAFSQNHPIPSAALAYAYAVSGKSAEARKIADDLKVLYGKSYISPYWIGLIYVGLGEKDSAFAWLEKGIGSHDGSMIFLKVEPILDSIRSDSRFAVLLARIGLAN